MWDWSFLIITALIWTWSGYLFYRVMSAEKDIVCSGRMRIVYCVVMAAAALLIIWAMCAIYYDYEYLERLKRLCLLAVIWPIAYIDYKTYRIPNVFIISGLVCRGGLLLAELLMNSSEVGSIVLSELAAAGALMLAAVLCRLMIKDAIGFGDMKLFILMGFMLGMDGIWAAMFLALIVAFIVSIFVLVTRRKSKKDVIPFGPALVIGIYLSVFLTGK